VVTAEDGAGAKAPDVSSEVGAAGNQGSAPAPDDSTDVGLVAGCVFCHPERTPGELTATPNLRLLPDLYPVAPGHLLVITKRHLPCYGAAEPALLDEVEGLAGLARRFIRDEFEIDPVIWENGVSGQTVFHAHLHLIPVHLEGLIDSLAEDRASIEIDGWEAVAERYRSHRGYHYAALGDRRWLLESDGAMNWEVRRLIAVAAGLRYVDGRWVRPTTEDDVKAVVERWKEWSRSSG
jgi:diadenosine tetraphosphate (Ap4A) HIT family hydrolase